MKLLIGSTNSGKVEEYIDALKSLPFEIIGLSDLDSNIPEPEEPFDDLVSNAIHKAKYYGDKTNLLTLADDTGLFVNSLDGWPGTHSSRIANTDDERCDLLLEKMKGVPKSKREAKFMGALALHDPNSNDTFIAQAEHAGEILLEKASNGKNGFGYDPLFYIKEEDRTYSEMTKPEKSSISWRGKAIKRVEYFLNKQYGVKQIVVPMGIIVNDEGKILMSLRNDPHNLEFHKKWEFPGGTLEQDESIEDNLLREVKEEVGYDIKIEKLLQRVITKSVSPTEGYTYQVCLLPVICTILEGNGESDDQEILETRWIVPDEMKELDLLGSIDIELLSEIKESIKELRLIK